MGRDHAGLSWDTLRSLDRIHPTPTKAQQEALDKLHRQFDEAEGDEDACDELSAKIDALESEIAFTAAEKAKSGVIVSIDHEGGLEITPGLVRPEDDEPRKKKAEGDSDAANVPPCFSVKLTEDPTAHRTAALQAMLTDNPEVALAAVTHALAMGVFYRHEDNLSSLRIAPRVVSLDRSAEGIAATPAHKALDGDVRGGDGAATTAMVLRQVVCHAEVSSAAAFLGSCWPCVFHVALEAMTLTAWAHSVRINRSVVLGFLIAGLDRLVEFYAAADRTTGSGRGMRTAQFSPLHGDAT
jgi:hypothetical protein